MRRFFGGKRGKFKVNDLVKLKDDATHPHLSGSVGIVVVAYGGDYPAYEVEFINAQGAVLDRLTLKEAELSIVEM